MRVKRGMTKADILKQYEAHMERLRGMGVTMHKELKDFEPMELPLIVLELHPVKRKDSIELTKKLIEVLDEQRIVTAKELYDTFGWADKPVMKRLSIMIKYGLVHREAKKYYLATPRLKPFKEKIDKFF